MDPYEWTDAKVTYPDWVGTAQLDEKMTGDESIYTITGVDRDEWQIVGLDIGAGESGTHAPHVIAVRRAELVGHVTDATQLNAADIQIHGVDAFELLKKITHVLDVRLRLRGVQDTPITITELRDEPAQD